jgi:septum site-determining protein MinD
MVEKRKNVIAVISPKGGVGKTVTTANLAAAIALEFDKKVLAIDTNISTASLGLHMDIFYPSKTIHDVLKKGASHETAVHKYHDNLHLIPASIKVRKEEKNIMQMRENVKKMTKFYDNLLAKLSKKYDLVLLDCAPGFDLEILSIMGLVGGFLLVTNPEYPALVTAMKAAEYAKRLNIPVGGVVLNKVTNKKYELSDSDVEEALNIKIIGKIPYDRRVKESVSYRVPVVIYKPRSKASKAYRKIAAEIMQQERVHSIAKGLRKFFKKKIRKEKDVE